MATTAGRWTISSASAYDGSGHADVSVIMAVYNGEQYLEAAIGSGPIKLLSF